MVVAGKRSTRLASTVIRLASLVLVFGVIGSIDRPEPARSQAQPHAGPEVFLPRIDNLLGQGTPGSTGQDPTQTPTPSTTPTPSQTSSPTQTSTPTFAADPRFGIITSLDTTNVLNQTGLSWWFQFGINHPRGPQNGVAQIAFANGRIPIATLQQQATLHPGSYWIIGNEPNVGDGSVKTGAQYATELQYYNQNIKAADSTAKLVGPNVLNWDNTCGPCPGFQPGHLWVDDLRTAWASQYGGEPPIDVWALHAYSEDYNSLFANHSLTDPVPLENDITGMSQYLSGIPAQASKPIWVTGFGIIWAFNGYSIVQGGCPDGTCYAPPAGTPTSVSYDSAGVTSFMNGFTSWAKTNGPALRLQKWFLYIASGTPESYMTVYAGISTMTDSGPTASLTTYGQLYRSEAGLP